jgi:hypothetical protein
MSGKVTKGGGALPIKGRVNLHFDLRFDLRVDACFGTPDASHAFACQRRHRVPSQIIDRIAGQNASGHGP